MVEIDRDLYLYEIGRGIDYISSTIGTSYQLDGGIEGDERI